jgi:hypothetical protein
MDAELGDSYPVYGSVGLAVSAPVEPELFSVAGPDRDGCSPGEHGIGVPVSESGDVGCFPDQFGCGKSPTTRKLEQRGSDLSHPLGDLSLQASGLKRDLSDPGQFGSGQVSDHSTVGSQQLLYLIQSLVNIEGTGRRIESGFEFMEPPTQPILNGGPFPDQDFSIVDQQLDLTRRSIQ